jgi:hypothetical protein
MRKGYVVKEKGYEYNDSWYDDDKSQDSYTNLFHDRESAERHAKKFTAEFIAGRSIYDYFTNQSYLNHLININNKKIDNFDNYYDINSELFNKIWSFIKNDIAVILEAEMLEGDPVVMNYSDGTKMYYSNNVLHRIGSPAIEKENGDWEYYYEGKRHRVDGPAVHFGSKYESDGFYIEGVYYWDMHKYREAAGLWIQKNRDIQINTLIGEVRNNEGNS